MNIEIDNNRNLVKFIDTENIKEETWRKMLTRFNYLGYDIRDIRDLKRYFNRHIFLQPDQSREVMQILKLKKPKNKISKQMIANANKKAVEYFGLTGRPELAGYILLDGSMLNFSYDGIKRTIDHRDIDDILDLNTEQSNTVSMHTFINYGNIRISSPTDIEIAKPFTEEQETVIRKLINRANLANLTNTFCIDIMNPEGYVIKSFKYDNENAEVILNDINKYFKSIAI